MKAAFIGRSGHIYLSLFRDDPNETLGIVGGEKIMVQL
jgi:hypothetical protein